MIKEGRVAVVSGGGRGLGRAIAMRLAREGADVAILARSADQVSAVAQDITRLGRRSRGWTVDVRSTAQVDAARDEILAEFGRVDIVVSSAGNLLYKPLVPLPGVDTAAPGFDHAISDEEWNEVIEVHLGGALRLARAFGPGLVAQQYGRVVTVVSNVVRRAVPFTVAYDAAKGGVIQLTRSLAREWARYGVTVNAVAPGHFPTSMSEVQFTDERLLRGMLRRIPAGRTGELEELAAMVAYLCAEDSGFVTGETIAVDGGETL
jgi:NAD(P)-dependent dehydrogenase (short-subunit alcohol dehydrogenase family)